MCDQYSSELPRLPSCDDSSPSRIAGSSRRRFLTGAGVAAAGAAAHILPGQALAQSAGTSPADLAELARVQGQRRILLKGGVVLTLDRQVGDFAAADILIEDGKIREIRPNIAVSADSAAVVDASNRILIPGFVDTHSHSYQGILRNILTSGLLSPDYNRDIQDILTPAFTAADVYAGVLVSALGFIDTGTTAVVDISHISHTPEHSDACIRALQDSGIRAVYAYQRGAGPAAQYPQDIGRLRRTYFSSKDQLLTLAMGTFTNAKAVAFARDAGVPAVMHLVGTNLTPQVLELGKAGMLRPGDIYIHCLGINSEAWKVIKETGGHISLCPHIDMAMGHGMPATQAALDHGFRPSLSSDHGVTLAQDFFTLMRTTYMLQRLLLLQRGQKGEQNLPPLLRCRDVLEFATIEGARCAGIETKVGTLTPGKDADIVMLRADRLDVWPLNNAPVTVVNLMNPSHVENVFIAGKLKKWRGNLVGVDEARVRRMVQEARDALLRRTGMRPNLLG